MKSSKMIPNTFSDYFKSLPEDGRQTIIDELTQILMNENKEARLQSFSEKKESVSCPSCSSNKISGNGKQKGVQRYVCRSCKKYFRDTTGLLTHNMKKSALVSKYMYNLLMGYSIRKCAKETGICIQTSFDWRHKIIGSLNAQRPSSFERIVESDDIFFLESSKGSRSLERERRSRGSKAKKRGISNEQIAVVVMKDDIIRSLVNKPSILERKTIGERVLGSILGFVDTFVNGVPRSATVYQMNETPISMAAEDGEGHR